MTPPERRSDPSEEQRGDGFTIDLDKLEAHAEELYLHRFVEQVRKVRGDHGRYLKLRSGDELAIRAAADGSSEILDETTVTETETS